MARSRRLLAAGACGLVLLPFLGLAGADCPEFSEVEELDVFDTTDTVVLANRVTECPSSQFHVTWHGSVKLNRTIDLDYNPSDPGNPGNLSLTIVGAGASDAEIRGDGVSRLFTYWGIYENTTVDVSLEASVILTLTNITLSGGRAFYDGTFFGHGGAVVFYNARLVANNVVFRDNRVDKNIDPNYDARGGAVYVSGPDTPSSDFRPPTLHLTNCVFEENMSSGTGAGLYVKGGRVVLEKCSFLGNAGGDGGGLAVEGDITGTKDYDTASVTVRSCMFERNYVVFDGGALRCQGKSTTTVTISIFRHNNATGRGGAVFATDTARVELLAETAVTENFAGSDGGGLFVQQSDTTLICNDTEISRNAAAENGGGIYAWIQVGMEWENCLVQENSADLIGAGLYMTGGCNLTAVGAGFYDNRMVIGAVVVVADGSRMATEGVAFTTNDTTNSLIIAVQTVATTTFTAYQDTFSGWSGEFAVYHGGTLMTLDDCDFTGSATAPYLVSTGDGAESPALVRNAVVGDSSWVAVGYKQNHDFGDGVVSCNSSAATGANYYVGEICSNGCEDTALSVTCLCYFPATVQESSRNNEECLSGQPSATFVHRLASSQVMLSDGTGDDAAYGEIFLSNEADAVGSVRWSVTVVSDEEGAATAAIATNAAGAPSTHSPAAVAATTGATSVAWVVTPSSGILAPGGSVTTRAFHRSGADNAALAGSAHVTLAVTAKTAAATADGSAAIVFYECDAGFYYDNPTGECLSCSEDVPEPDGMDCSAPGNDLYQLNLVNGWWRATTTTLDLRECFNPDACAGGAASSPDGYCTGGYSGPYCGVCQSGYAHVPGDVCRRCSAEFEAGMWAIAAVAGFLLLLLCLLALHFLMEVPEPGQWARRADGVNGGLRQLMRRIPFHKLKTPIIVYQIITQFVVIVGADLPPLYKKFVAALNFINLDFGGALEAGCLLSGVDFYDRILFATLAPLAMLLVLGLTFAVASARCRWRPPPPGPAFAVSAAAGRSPAEAVEALRRLRMRVVVNKHILAVLLICFLIYSSVSTMTFQTFQCVHIETGSFLRADLSLQCGTPEHTVYQAYSAVMIAVYPAGIPLSYVYFLLRHRRRISEATPLAPAVQTKPAVQKVRPIQPRRGGGVKKAAEAVVAAPAADSVTGDGSGGAAAATNFGPFATALYFPLTSNSSGTGGGNVDWAELGSAGAAPAAAAAAAADSKSKEETEALSASTADGAAGAGCGPVRAPAYGDSAAVAAPRMPPPPEPATAAVVAPAAMLPAAVVLTLAYRKERFWWEPVECLRRLLLTAALTFILPDTPGQVAIACSLCVFFICVSTVLQPFEGLGDIAAYTLGGLIVFLTFYMTLIVDSSFASADSSIQYVLSAFLMALNLLLLATAAAQMYFGTEAPTSAATSLCGALMDVPEGSVPSTGFGSDGGADISECAKGIDGGDGGDRVRGAGGGRVGGGLN